MKNLKTITTDEFLEKFDNDTLEDEDLKAIYYYLEAFEDTDNSYWEEVERGKYYKIFKIVLNNFLERYFIKISSYETGPIFELKYKEKR
ncbi:MULTISPECIES: hypothetical protein [Fusobacterium]|uniref:Uncharacterized protein n=1 Tax=Fusobacterium animalis F0419 TaxID=999414 RepID=H1HEZ1_9FUSO|nr:MULTISPECIES: hypothetical protein [Fusobacterium]EHO78143.1 hypothetical protein HMPREF9942_01042 [Fusobacterium animalis F0419]EUB41055.1 hypothetical protein HMPREF1498_1496 [Fusobacterium sp. CM1]